MEESGDGGEVSGCGKGERRWQTDSTHLDLIDSTDCAFSPQPSQGMLFI